MTICGSMKLMILSLLSIGSLSRLERWYLSKSEVFGTSFIEAGHQKHLKINKINN
jgi:hypothetical protein